MTAAVIEAFEPQPPRLTPMTLRDLLTREIPPRAMLLSPWLPEKGLAMIYAKRGVGKTHLALAISLAVASGAAFLRWKAPAPRRVLYIDGEMPLATLQERAARMVEEIGGSLPADDYWRLEAADSEEWGIPDLSTQEGQEALAEIVGDAELIVLDNLSTLCRSGRENEAESWGAVQHFLLQMRREGRAVLLVHHAGKAGEQRGTSKREDVLDTSIKLDRPQGYSPSEGARFVISFEKSRGFAGPDAEPFEAVLDPISGWSMRDLEDVTDARIIELTGDGLSATEIGKEIGLHKSNVSRRQSKLREEGRLA